MSSKHTVRTYTRYTTDNMHKSHRYNAAAYTPCVCDTPIYMRSISLRLVVFIGACRPYSTVCLTRDKIFSSYIHDQADVPVHLFVCVARSTAHGPDNTAVHRACLPPASYTTTTLLPSSSRAHTLCVWTIVYTMVVDSPETAIDHLITPCHPSLCCCFFWVLLCVIQHWHCSHCTQHSAPAAAAHSVLSACGRSALYSQYYSAIA